MTDDINESIDTDPISDLRNMVSSPADGIINDIQSNLSIATDIRDNVESELAVAMAGCLQDSLTCDNACQQCVKGVLETDLQSLNSTLDKITGVIERGIQNPLSSAIQSGVAVGIPITDLITVNGTAITTDGVANVIPENPPIQVVASICDPGTVPVTTPDNRIACVAETTPPTVIDAIEKGRVNVPTVPAPPTTPPVTPPTTPTTAPTGGNPFEIPGDFKICVQDEFTQRTITWAEYLNTHLVSGVSFDLQSTYQHALDGGALFANVGLDNHVGFTNAGTCGITENPSCPPCPQGTGTTTTVTPTTEQPRSTHPFCDPDNLRIPDVGNTHRTPAAATGDSRLITLGSDISTILYQPTGNDAMDALTGILGAPIVVGGYGIDFVVNGINAIIGGVGDAAGKGFATIIGGLAKLAGPLLESGPCQSEPFTSLAAVNFLPSLLQVFGGCIPSQITTPNVYAMNYLCPVLIPSGPDMNRLRSQGIITDSQWRIGVRANNLCPDWQEKIVDSMKTVPTPDQIQMAWRRGIIDDEAYDYYMKRNGILTEEDANVFFKLTEFVPGPSDLVRFMVRDAFDDSLETNKLADQELPAKFTERAKQWAADQGIPEDVFRYFWRAHYEYPSPTQLYSMLHRLRKRTPLPNNQGFADPVDVSLIRKVLQINDLSPEFVDRLIALSFNPLTRVDSRRAFEIGELSEEELRDAYLDLGYSPENADRLLKFSRATSGPIRAKRLGNASTTEVLSWYKENLIPRDQAVTLLESSGIPASSVSKYIETADLRRVTQSRKEGIKAIRKRWMTGEFSVTEATDALNRLSVSPDRIGELLYDWSLIRDAKYKAPTVSMLCQWWSRGLITIDEFSRRCTNIGYSLVDAERIIRNCQGQDTERKAAEAEKLAKEAERRQRQIESDRRRAIRDQKTLEREIKAALAEAAPCKPPPKPTCEVNGTT